MILSLKKVAVMTAIISLLGVVATYGLKALTFEEIASPVEEETTYGPIKLTATLDKSVYRLGENVNVTLRITNIDNKTIRLSFATPIKVDFAVYDESLQLIYVDSFTYGTIFITSSVALEPEESLVRTLQWGQQKIVGGNYSKLEPVNLGTYFISGQTGPGYILVKPYDQEIEKIETPKIQIAITR